MLNKNFHLTLWILCVVLIPFFNGCSPVAMDVESYFTMSNQSDLKVAYMLSENYPDTTLPSNRIVRLDPGKSHREGVNFLKLEDYFESLPKDTLTIFYIDSDTLDLYGVTKVRDYNKILLKKDISKADIGSDGIIFYP